MELAYAVASGHWGRGYATEMAGAMLAVGFEELGLGGMVSFTLATNAASRRVMEKVGFAYEREIVHAGLPHVLYRLSASGWRAQAMSSAAARTARRHYEHTSGG